PDMDGIELARMIKADSAMAGVRLVMLTSVSQYGEFEAAQQTGIAAYLSKPVRQSELYNCLVGVVAALSPPGPHATEITQLGIGSDSGESTIRVLLAEDNPVIQEVAVSMLELLGFRVDIANTGQEAVAAMAHTDYALVLMDCHMPQVDGIEATKLIRAHEIEA